MSPKNQSAFYKAFYKWGERDFMTVPAYELQVGDEIAYSYGGDLRYGAIPIESITRVPGAGILLQYILPIGAIAQSNPTTSIAVYWKDTIPDIHISQDITFHDRILIRRK
jgi:hypothetical protein